MERQWGQDYYRATLELARHIHAGPGPEELRAELLSKALHVARRTAWVGRFVVSDVLTIDVDGAPYADRDEETAKFPGDRPDCVYWDLPLNVLRDYVDHLLTTGFVGRGEATKRAGTSSRSLNERLERMHKRPTITHMSIVDAELLAAIATGRQFGVKALRTALASAKEWHLKQQVSHAPGHE